MHRQNSPRPNPAETITRAIIERLEAGVKPWVQPWTGASISRPLRACGTPYQGINVVWLWMTAQMGGFASPYWMTYLQAQKLGGQVRRGERSTIAVFYKSYSAEVEDRATGETQQEARRVLKSFPVFNASQVDGLPERFSPAPPAPVQPADRDPALAAFFAQVPASLRKQGVEAYYEPGVDRITMPPETLFRDLDHYWATLAHELAHWTGHRTRLDRDLGQRFGTNAYAMEELVAELASALIGADLGLPIAHLDHHASYIASWLKVLRSDSRAVLTAAAKAEQAAQLVLALGRPSADHGVEPELLAA